MAAAAYTTDLTTGNYTLSTCEATTGWAEPTATGWLQLNTFAQETENYIQGTYCVSGTVKVGVGGLMFDAGSNQTIPTDGAFGCWVYWSTPGSLGNEAAGGIRLVAGNALNQFDGWSMLGSDSYQYGGWVFLVANPTVTQDWRPGSAPTGYRYFGWCYNAPTSAPTKGSPFAVDVLRYGRFESRYAGGTAPDAACNFAGFATYNDNASNRFGIMQATSGGYLFMGLMVIGYGAACRHTDSNTMVLIANTKKVTAAFNKIEIRNASTQVNWTNISFVALGTVSKGRLEVVDDCDVNISGCTFNGMDTFIFKTTSEVLSSTFLKCGIVTANGANFSGTKFTGYDGAADSSQLVWDGNYDTDGKLNGCTFDRTGGANATHALTLGTTSPTSVTIRNCTFTSYNAANAANDSTIYVARTTGTVTINVVSCSGNISYKTAGATVVIASNPVSATVTVKDTAVPPAIIEAARVLVLAYSGGPMPYNVTVTSITNSGTTATVNHTAHGMATNDKVQITGASLWENNGVFSIVKVNDNQYTYTLPSAPGSNPTGTIKATYVALEGLTAAGTGQITMSRSFTSDQPVTGRARKASGAPYFKTTEFTGTIKSASGMDVTVQLLPDA